MRLIVMALIGMVLTVAAMVTVKRRRRQGRCPRCGQPGRVMDAHDAWVSDKGRVLILHHECPKRHAWVVEQRARRAHRTS